MDKLQREVLLAALDWVIPNGNYVANSIALATAVQKLMGLNAHDSDARWREVVQSYRAKLTENPNA